MRRIIVCLALIMPALCAATPAPVNTSTGPVQGHDDHGAQAWLGVPYAAAPIGELRWQAPQPHATWSQPLNAAAYGSPCMQIGSVYGPPPAGHDWGVDNVYAFGKPVGSEDCLSLNLWCPASEDHKLPVLVFIHGGSGVAGSSSDPIYNGAKLAQGANALVVTLNYRLGMLGSLSHPALEGSDPLTNSGNYALLDVIAALRFVQANAEAFGGDPHNVTLMGQSAGAIMLYSLMVSPQGQGLFHKAVAMSGLAGGSTEKSKGQEYTEKLAAALIVNDGLAPTAAAAQKLIAAQGQPWLRHYLKSKPAEDILKFLAANPNLRHGPGGFGDGVVLPVDASDAFEQGRTNHAPLIAGVTRDEAKLLAGVFRLSDAERFRLMQQTASRPSFADLISPWMLPSLGPGVYNAYTRAITTILLHGVNTTIDKAAKYGKVYVYRFDWDHAPEPWNQVYGAAHGIDLPFVFGNFTRNFFAMDFTEQTLKGREALSALMMHTLGTFARTGDPNTPDLSQPWQPWSSGDGPQQRFVFDATDDAPALSVN